MKRLPDAEFEVMSAVWDSKCPVSTADIKAAAERERAWNMSALQTVLSRLEEKGYLRSEKSGRNRFYEVLVTRDEYLLGESRSFIDRLGGKKLTSLVAALYDSKSITDDDLRELRDYIDGSR